LCGRKCPVKQDFSCFVVQFPGLKSSSIFLTGGIESPVTWNPAFSRKDNQIQDILATRKEPDPSYLPIAARAGDFSFFSIWHVSCL
jgi:hypothetical protein